MSGLEIERKFLVKKGDAFKRAAFSCSHIKQGYIPCDNATVRIRLRKSDEKEEAFLTIKGQSVDGGLSRYEFEKEITMDEAENLLKLCRGGVIDKHRYLVKSGEHTFEVDEFHGDNDGLLMAEVELKNERDAFKKPDFIGPEVTGDRRFYNKHMLMYPFSLWRDTLPEEFR
ncbi:MAG: CYTH domain-containing protein [Prevotella sp.]|nr:CYTH domain-containing protein [Prevotella sp.]